MAMAKKERVRAALRHEPVDKVPKGELDVARPLAEALGLASDDEFTWQRRVRERLKMDLFDACADWPPGELLGSDEQGRQRFRTWYGTEVLRTDSTLEVVRPAFATDAGYEAFVEPTVGMMDTSRLERWRDETDFFIFGQTGGVFDTLLWLFGFEPFMELALGDPARIKPVAEAVARFHMRLGRRYMELGLDLVLVADDIAYNSGPFLSPRLCDELVFPYHEQIVRGIKAAYPDAPIMLHSDGNLNPVMDRIVACGYDGVQSLQPSAGMDIARIKRRYGERLCLMGNLDLDRLLPLGTPDEVRAATRALLETAAPGSGFILSTCNVLTKDVPAANALAMYEEAEAFRL
jgi:uroporphyrinogen decarboxylase